jgi:hypothetical protein
MGQEKAPSAEVVDLTSHLVHRRNRCETSARFIADHRNDDQFREIPFTHLVSLAFFTTKPVIARDDCPQKLADHTFRLYEEAKCAFLPDWYRYCQALENPLRAFAVFGKLGSLRF